MCTGAGLSRPTEYSAGILVMIIEGNEKNSDLVHKECIAVFLAIILLKLYMDVTRLTILIKQDLLRRILYLPKSIGKQAL